MNGFIKFLISIHLKELREGNRFMAEKLAAKIEEYGKYC